MPPNFNPRDHFNDDDDGDDYKHDDINQIYHEWSTSSTTIGRNIPTSTVGAAATPVATDSNSRTDSGIITDATVVSLQPDQGVNPVAVLVPVFAGVAVLVLLMGCFFFWRRRRAAAAAAALAAAGAGAGAVYTEKVSSPI